ncbi:MAG: YceI family protein [Pseudomonadota bacterium]
MLCVALPVWGEPRSYALDTAASSVSFTYFLNGAPGKGTMPVRTADLDIDFSDLSQSTAFVELDVAGSQTSAVFVTQALKGPDVLDVAAHPTVTFRSRSAQGSIAEGVDITGDVTIRGVTRPMVLTARIFRPQGSDTADLSRLVVFIEGAINRSDFGASGYSGFVDDRVELDIRATISER